MSWRWRGTIRDVETKEGCGSRKGCTVGTSLLPGDAAYRLLVDLESLVGSETPLPGCKVL